MSKDVLIYTTPICPMCEKAKQFLKEENIDYQEVDITTDSDKREEIIEKTGQTSVPVIEIGDKTIIGFNKKKIRDALKE